MFKKTSIGLFLLLFLVAATFQCTFDPDQEYFKEVEKATASTTSLSFFSGTDTLEMRGSVEVNFNVPDLEDVVRYTLTLDDAVITDQTTGFYNVYINSRRFPDGIYDLKLTLKKRLRGESLAAQRNIEYGEQVFTKKVVIFNAPIPMPEMSTSIQNGVLVLSWKPYTGRRFEKYTVRGSAIELLTITDPKQTSIPITDFCGGPAYFSITVYAFGDTADEQKEFDYSLNALITKTSEGISVTWDESPFVSYAGAEIEISVSQQTVRFDIDKDTRSFKHDLAWTFPHSVSVMISSISKNNVRSTFGWKYYTTQTYLGSFGAGLDIFRTSRDTVFITSHESVGSSTYSKYFRLINSKTGSTISNRGGFAGISPDGKLLYEFHNKTTLMRVDVNTFDYVEAIDVSSFISNINVIHGVFVSDGNVVVLYVEHQITSKIKEDWVYAIDCNSKQLLYKNKIPTSSKLEYVRGKLSRDGRTFFQYNKVVKIDETPLEVVKGLQYESPYYQIPLIQRDEVVTRNYPGYLLERGLYAPHTSIVIPYEKDVIKVFASDDNNVIGIAYVQNNLLHFDFMEAGTLNTLATLETTLPNYYQNYRFHIVDHTFLVYSINTSEFHKYDF